MHKQIPLTPLPLLSGHSESDRQQLLNSWIDEMDEAEARQACAEIDMQVPTPFGLEVTQALLRAYYQHSSCSNDVDTSESKQDTTNIHLNHYRIGNKLAAAFAQGVQRLASQVCAQINSSRVLVLTTTA